MQDSRTPHRRRLTFSSNGILKGQRMAEITAELVEDHEPSADRNLAAKQSWFGQENSVAAALELLGVPQRDVDGVLATLHVNKTATLELELNPDQLHGAGFAPSR